MKAQLYSLQRLREALDRLEDIDLDLYKALDAMYTVLEMVVYTGGMSTTTVEELGKAMGITVVDPPKPKLPIVESPAVPGKESAHVGQYL